MSVTIKDIAKAASVSHTTVSRVLNGNPAISPETSARVLKIAQKMGYTPNAVAQSLQNRRTYTIGMVVTTISDPFITNIVEGAEALAHEAGYSLFLCAAHRDPDREMAVVSTLQRRRVDGIIVTSSRVGALQRARLEALQVPVALLNQDTAGSDLYNLTIDNEYSAYLAVTHLLELGHRRIAFVHGMNRLYSSNRRLAGYQKALENYGIELDETLIVHPTGGDDYERGHQVWPVVWAQRPTAVFCYNDLIAIGMMVACKAQGIRIPEQISIVGFDNIEACEYTTPQLTTIHQPRRRLGRRVMQMVLDLIDNKPVINDVLPGHLIVRGTTSRVGSRE